MVWTSARSSVSRNTAASSPVGVPTRSRGSVAAGSVRTIGSRSAAASLHPQPAPEDSEVSGIVAGDVAMRGGYPWLGAVSAGHGIGVRTTIDDLLAAART